MLSFAFIYLKLALSASQPPYVDIEMQPVVFLVDREIRTNERGLELAADYRRNEQSQPRETFCTEIMYSITQMIEYFDSLRTPFTIFVCELTVFAITFAILIWLFWTLIQDNSSDTVNINNSVVCAGIGILATLVLTVLVMTIYGYIRYKAV